MKKASRVKAWSVSPDVSIPLDGSYGFMAVVHGARGLPIATVFGATVRAARAQARRVLACLWDARPPQADPVPVWAVVTRRGRWTGHAKRQRVEVLEATAAWYDSNKHAVVKGVLRLARPAGPRCPVCGAPRWNGYGHRWGGTRRHGAKARWCTGPKAKR